MNLQKAPPVWDALGELGPVIRSKIREVIERAGVVYDTFAHADDPDAADLVREALAIELTDPQGWTIGRVADRLQDVLDVPQRTPLDYARNEIAAVMNTARDELYDEYAEEVGADTSEMQFSWVGPDAHRTTDICREIKTKVEYFDGSVTQDELRMILGRKARKYEDDGGTPERVKNWVPHHLCRHTLRREATGL